MPISGSHAAALPRRPIPNAVIGRSRSGRCGRRGRPAHRRRGRPRCSPSRRCGPRRRLVRTSTGRRTGRGVLQGGAHLAGMQRVDPGIAVEDGEEHGRDSRRRRSRGGTASSRATSRAARGRPRMPYSSHPRRLPGRTARTGPGPAPAPSRPTAANSSGRWVSAAPTIRPPLDSPKIPSWSGVVQPSVINFSAAATKSSKTFCLAAQHTRPVPVLAVLRHPLAGSPSANTPPASTHARAKRGVGRDQRTARSRRSRTGWSAAAHVGPTRGEHDHGDLGAVGRVRQLIGAPRSAVWCPRRAAGTRPWSGWRGRRSGGRRSGVTVSV